MKAANVLDANGNKVAKIEVYFDGYQLTGGYKGYQFFNEWTTNLAQSTVRRHAIESARLYMNDDTVTISRLTKTEIK